jgi:hypothetical protein
MTLAQDLAAGARDQAPRAHRPMLSTLHAESAWLPQAAAHARHLLRDCDGLDLAIVCEHVGGVAYSPRVRDVRPRIEHQVNFALMTNRLHGVAKCGAPTSRS